MDNSSKSKNLNYISLKKMEKIFKTLDNIQKTLIINGKN